MSAQPFLWILHHVQTCSGCTLPHHPGHKGRCYKYWPQHGALVYTTSKAWHSGYSSVFQIYPEKLGGLSQKSLLWQTLYWIPKQCKWSLQKVSLQWLLSVVTEKMGYIGSLWTSEIYTFLLQSSILRWFPYKSHYLNGKLCFSWDREKDTLHHWSIFYLWYRTTSKSIVLSFDVYGISYLMEVKSM